MIILNIYINEVFITILINLQHLSPLNLNLYQKIINTLRKNLRHNKINQKKLTLQSYQNNLHFRKEKLIIHKKYYFFLEYKTVFIIE